MILTKTKVNAFLLYVIFFLTFFGFYAILLLTINAGMSGFTRMVTIPVRVAIGVFLVGLLLLNIRKIKFVPETVWFLSFSALYVARIIVDHYLGEQYNRTTSELLFYYGSFAVIPFLSIGSFRLTENHLPVILKALMLSGFAFAVLALLVYGSFIGQVSRLSSSSAGEDVLSPLALSYSSIMVIGTGAFYLMYNPTSKWKAFLIIFSIGISIIPFFLGASRGALLALFVPFVMLAFSRINLKVVVRGVFLTTFFIVSLLYLDEMLGSGLLRRFTNISTDIETGNSSAARLEIWKVSFNQFMNHPIFGDKLRVDYPVGYAHNFFVEVLQTTGILGFIPFTFLVVRALLICVKNFKTNERYAWIFILFIQSFVQNMFSGALFTGAWFWTSMALVFALERFFSKKNNMK